MASGNPEREDGHLVPILPADTAITYLDEGAANIVYRISVRPPTPEPSQREDYGDGTPPPTEIEDPLIPERNAELVVYEDKLLRVRKDLPTTLPCALTQDAWHRLISPIFDEDQVVKQFLVQLRPGGIIHRLNEELQAWERESSSDGASRSRDPRPAKRQGIYLADDEHGLLVTDMTPGPAGEGVIEFKPKWLDQSPSAPKDSKRCRTCARTARVNAEHSRKGQSLKKSFCPLDLVSEEDRDVLRAAEIVLSPESQRPTILRFVKWLQTNTLLRRIRNAQKDMDGRGVFNANPNDEHFLAAMTLRDCTVFVRLPEDSERDHEIEARIGDLDLKSPVKSDYWKSCELPLIEEGWYTGTEKEEDWQPLDCHLSPDRWGPTLGKRGRNA